MNTTSFIYYGYSRDTYRDCRPQIQLTNLKHMMFMNSWLLAVTLIFLGIRIYDNYAVSSVFVRYNMNGLDRVGIGTFVCFFVLALVAEVFVILSLKDPRWRFNFFIYPSMLLMMGFSLLVSIAQPQKPAILFYVLLVLIAVSYIDTMVNMGIALTFFSIIFWLSVQYGFSPMRFQQKPPSIANEDIFYTVLILSLSLVLHYTRQRTRLQQFVTYLKNIQITNELEIKSSYDALTSLFNRARFMSMATEVLKGSHEDYMVVCLLDLDSFKQINDKLGHQMGDKALQITGRTIAEGVVNLTKTLDDDKNELARFSERVMEQKLSFAGRLGGDEFIMLIRGENDREAARTRLQSILDRLNAVEFGDLHGIHASFGVTEIVPGDNDIDKVYNRADDALYQSKRAGKNQITFSEAKG
ncbi:MAG: GGDEF domain-containing protein [Lachnospiraceae bacterium]|nr:GGDEF domain-containing protein [Lachnospiraceae bacterium]